MSTQKPGNFVLFSVGPRSFPFKMNELRYLLAGKPEREQTWSTKEIVKLLLPHFQIKDFNIFGCAGAFLNWPRGLDAMAEAVLEIEVSDGVVDRNRYFRSEGSDIIEIYPSSPIQSVLLQGFATTKPFCEIAKQVRISLEDTISTTQLLQLVRQKLKIQSTFSALVIEIDGTCRFRSALNHPNYKSSGSQELFSEYVYKQYTGKMLFRGISSNTEYTKSGGHVHGFSLNSDFATGGHLVRVGPGEITVLLYTPSRREILQMTY